MKWREEGQWLAVSDKSYKVAKFIVGSQTIYRASIRGEFIGEPKETFSEAREIFENNLAIMGEQQGEE